MTSNGKGFRTAALLISAIVGIALFAVPIAANATTTVSWQARRAPLPSGALGHNQYAFLSSVSCPMATCSAVGAYATSASEQGLIDTRASGKWSAQQAPVPDGQSPQSLRTLACSSGGMCLAFPYGASYLDVLDGGSWTAQSVSVPAGATDLALGAAACWQSGCVATGTYDDSSDQPQWTVVTDSAGTWTANPVALSVQRPSGFFLDANAISCRSNGSCEAVGRYGFRPGPGPEDVASKPLVVTGSAGSGWTGAVPKLPANAERYRYASTYPNDGLNAVSCPGSGACIAVGEYTDTSYAEQGLIADNKTAVESPVPASGTLSYPGAGLVGVACPSAAECTIAGTYAISSSVQGFTITGSGTSWTVAAAPLPLPADASSTDPQVVLYGLSCNHTGACAIAGQYADSSSNFDALLLNGSGASWQPTEAPAPTGASQVGLSGVSCGSTSCVAVGSYYAASGNNTEGLIDTLSLG